MRDEDEARRKEQDAQRIERQDRELDHRVRMEPAPASGPLAVLRAEVTRLEDQLAEYERDPAARPDQRSVFCVREELRVKQENLGLVERCNAGDAEACAELDRRGVEVPLVPVETGTDCDELTEGQEQVKLGFEGPFQAVAVGKAPLALLRAHPELEAPVVTFTGCAESPDDEGKGSKPVVSILVGADGNVVALDQPLEPLAAEPYECQTCGGAGRRHCTAENPAGEPCDDCDGVGITAIDCPGCDRKAVPIHETVFVAAIPRTYCETCGDRELEKIAAARGRARW